MVRVWSAVVLGATLVVLGGCASNSRFYAAEGYAREGVVSEKTFDQVVAECRHSTLSHNALMDTYSLEVPRFKACMQAQGYKYQGE